MMSLENLLSQEGVLWSVHPPENSSPFDRLMWSCASELASTMETFMAVDQFDEVAPEAIKSLQAVEIYLENKGILRPQSMLLILLRLRRHQAGLQDQ